MAVVVVATDVEEPRLERRGVDRRVHEVELAVADVRVLAAVRRPDRHGAERVQELVGGLTWALVKGRGNYVSIRRALLAAESQASLFPEDRSSEIGSLLEWIRVTEDGSLSDLPFVPSEETWDEVRRDADVCLRGRCPQPAAKRPGDRGDRVSPLFYRRGIITQAGRGRNYPAAGR
mgnify:CR=1 FL=1